MPANGEAIVIEGLRKTYASGLIRRRRVEALRGVSFAVQRGEIFGLLGPNGAGKTTLIKVLLGIVRRNGGEAGVLGRPPGDRNGRKRIGYLPETHRIPRHHTGYSALAYYGQLSGIGRRESLRRAKTLLDQVGLSGNGTMLVRKYSKGMQQRLGLAQAMLHNPELLILDEPTDGVDPIGRNEIRGILKRLRDEGKTIFVNSHLLQEVELICDRVAVLVEGTVRGEGRVSDLTKHQGNDTEFIVCGGENEIRSALASVPITTFAREDAGTFRVDVRLDDQAAIDACVDRLRAAGISLSSLSRRRSTLEEAFMHIVREEPPPL